MAALKKLPILYLVQDNEWDISAHAKEMRAVDATHYAKGFGLKTYTIDGTDFTKSYKTIQKAFKEIREKKSNFSSCKSSSFKSPYFWCSYGVVQRRFR